MNHLIFPEIFRSAVTAFFTGKKPGADSEKISSTLKIDRRKIFFPIQKHTERILVLESSLKPEIADAVVTREKGILIGVQVADCVPVLIYEEAAGVIAAVHAGWRGTAEGILKKTIGVMTARLGCRPEGMRLAIGPSIRGCSYEVDADVARIVNKASGEGAYSEKKGDKYFIDLALANNLQAISMKVPESNIWISPDCTYCKPDKYYSYRYAKGPTGRQGGFIGMI